MKLLPTLLLPLLLLAGEEQPPPELTTDPTGGYHAGDYVQTPTGTFVTGDDYIQTPTGEYIGVTNETD